MINLTTAAYTAEPNLLILGLSATALIVYVQDWFCRNGSCAREKIALWVLPCCLMFCTCLMFCNLSHVLYMC
jgi:hypothetical protein